MEGNCNAKESVGSAIKVRLFRFSHDIPNDHKGNNLIIDTTLIPDLHQLHKLTMIPYTGENLIVDFDDNNKITFTNSAGATPGVYDYTNRTNALGERLIAEYRNNYVKFNRYTTPHNYTRGYGEQSVTVIYS